MSANKRASLIGKLQTALKKYYKPLPAQPTRPLLEHVLYASLLEDAPAELADEGIAKCEQEFFDWNEVRVTTATELSQVLSRLPEPMKAARRLKGNLQAIFEEFYTFDLDHLKKENLGKAVNKFERMPTMTPFVLSYTIQHGLGGHSIPVDYSAMVIMLSTEIASQPEAMTGKVPGLERAIPKSKGIEFAGLLHQAAVALNKSTRDKTARTMMDAVAKGSSKRLDEWIVSRQAAKKRAVKRKTKEKAEAEEARLAAIEAAKNAPVKKRKGKESAKKEASAKAAPAKPAPVKPATTKAASKSASEKQSTKSAAPSKKTAAPSKKASKKVAKKKPAATKKKVASKTVAKKSASKKGAKKSATKKKVTASKPAKKAGKKSTKKSANRKLTKRKPR